MSNLEFEVEYQIQVRKVDSQTVEKFKNCQLYRPDNITSEKDTLCDQIVKIIQFLKMMY